MCVYITCQPNIGCVITTLSKFSSEPTIFHYKLLYGITKYLQSIFTWGICFNQPSPLKLDKSQESIPYPELANSEVVSPVDVNRPVLQVFTDAAFGNDLTRRRSITGIILLIVVLTPGSSTKAEFIASVTAAKLT